MNKLAAFMVFVVAPYALSQSTPSVAPASRPAVSPLATTQTTQSATPEFVRIMTATIDGYAVAIPGNYAGKLVLIHVWATWCPSCAREVPFWKEAYATYHDRGVEFLGLPTDKNRRTSEAGVRAGVARHGLTWSQVYEDAPSLSMELKANTIPMSFLVDGDTGEVFFKGNAIRKKNLARRIEEALILKAGRDLQRKALTTSRPAETTPSDQPR